MPRRRPPPQRPRPEPNRDAGRRGRDAAGPAPGRRRRAVALGLAAAGLAALAAWAWSARRDDPARAGARAEAAARAGDWAGALDAWRVANRAGRAGKRGHLGEARAAAALGRPSVAEDALRRATAADPTDPEPWRLWLEILRVEDRPGDALRVGLAGIESVPADARRGVLRALTLALLADLPDDLARRTLARWADDAGGRAPDPDALAALYQRMNAMPRAGDPDRDRRIERLRPLVAGPRGRLPAREALATALADAGETDAGRRALDDWPAERRDARYWRLRGRWDLEYDRAPDRAADAFARALEELPHDWKTRVRLARAYHALGRPDEARAQAEAVNRLRERLDPATLGPLLARGTDDATADDLGRLADLCDRVGLDRLARAWRREATRPPAAKPLPILSR